jgi:hypothetical protein
MSGVALTNIAFSYPETRDESVQALDRMITAMLTPAVRRYEVLWWGEDALDTLSGDNGHIGYLAHLGLLLCGHKFLGGDDRYDDLLEGITAAFARRMRASPSRYLETFPGIIFTADNMPVVAVLAMRDKLFPAKYQDLISEWLEYTKTHLLDEESGMMRYHVTSDGQAAGTPRGVLQAWNSMWLPMIDETFAKRQYDAMVRNLFDVPAPSFGGIREYPRGKSGPTDMISAPIVFGISGSATGFAIAGARYWKDLGVLTPLMRTTELAGFTISHDGKRSYALGPLVGEAIVLAAKTMTLWDGRFSRK